MAEDAIAEALARRKAENHLRELELDSDLREKFISLLSHDIRNPLTAAKASAEMIARNPNDPRCSKRFAEMIIEAIGRADKMVSDLLDERRLRSGERLPVSLAPCDLNEIVRKLLGSLSAAYPERFRFDGKGAIGGTWDADALRRAIENLLSNALKYGAPDRPIRLATGVRQPDAWISVHNEGNEISLEEQGKLFQWFGQTSSARATRSRGWGLGLIVVKGIVEAHGGQVLVESGSGKGTTFTLVLPLAPRN